MSHKEDDFRTIKEDAMFMAMSEKYGKIPEDRDTVIKSLKDRIEELKEKEKIDEALKTVEGIKKGDIKVYPIDTLWEQI